MSKSKDRVRAESGIIFRDGRLVRKEDWFAAHPTKQTQQAKVDKAVENEMQAKYPTLDPKDTSAVLAEQEPYFCNHCKVTHRRGKIHQEHHKYIRINGIPEDGSDPTHD